MSPVAQHNGGRAGGFPTPYVELDRSDWSRLRRNQPLNLTSEDVARLRGLGDPLDLTEIEEVYLPLSRLLTFYVEAIHRLHSVTGEFLDERPHRTPFIIGVAGSVAVGKSTTARILRETWRHYLAAAPRDARTGRDAKAERDALDRIVREQAFTVLNRLCALRMAEARGLLIESVGRGHDSRGFALYRNVAGPALGLSLIHI